MKKIILSIASALCLSGCLHAQQEKGKVVIQGIMNGDSEGHNKVFMYTRMGSDSALIENGRFTFEFPFEGRTQKFFYIRYSLQPNRSYRPFPLLIEGPGTITVTGNIKTGFNDVEISGSEASELYNQTRKKQGAAYKKVYGVLEEMYGKSWLQPQDAAYKAYQKSNDSLTKLYMVPLLKELVKEHPDNYATVFVLASSGRNLLSIEDQEALYKQLSDEMQQSKEGLEFHAHTQGLKSSAVGSKVADFTLPDPKGSPVDFSAFKGKYVLIDFWASWCVPCRKSFPRMRQVYKQYKDNGFEIYSISIDENKDAWLKAVKDEKNPWAQSLDTKNIASSGFAVTAVPTTYLIDPQGKIVMKEIGFDPEGGGAIELKLEELFGEKMPKVAAEQEDKSPKKAIPMMKMN